MGSSLVFEKTPSYISWCFQKIDWFCISDEIFNQLPIVLALRKVNKLNNVNEQKDWLKILIDLHNIKKSNLNNPSKINEEYDIQDYNSDKNWLAISSGINNPVTMNDVFWNLD